MSFTALYRQPVLLDRNQHRGKRLKPPTDGRMASAMNASFVAASEFPECAKEFVIGFVTAGAAGAGPTEVTPVALLGLRQQENLFVAPDGRWDARYVPAFIRRYPLAYARTPDGQHNLMVDAAYEGFQDSEGELLVQPDGAATPYLQEMMKFLDLFEQELERTRVFCARLVELELLKPVQIDVNLAAGQTLAAGGVQVVDEAKLKALPEATVAELLRNGMLGLLYAHLLSTSNVQRLSERLGQRMAAVPAESAASTAG